MSRPPLISRALRAYAILLVMMPGGALAQTVTQRGFAEGRLFLFPQNTPADPTRAVGDWLIREELFAKPAPWVRFAGGLDLRANSYEQVEDVWRVDVSDRGRRRPRLTVRRLMATFTRGLFTLDVGKQFIRWGKADIVNPTDRFAPRDFLNVVDAEFLAVTAARAVAQVASETFEVVWSPRFTPSRVPLLGQRWTVVPQEASTFPLVDAGARLPGGSETGVRWGHVGAALEYSISFFDGFNHLPNVEAQLALAPGQIEITRVYPAIRTYGADAAIPSRWFTVKGEAVYFTSRDPGADEYVIYVLQLERQSGEWVLVGGYAGEVVTAHRAQLTFAPDRGLARAFVGRAAYTIDPNRSVALEAAIRQNGRGVWTKGEYSQARGQHWRATATVALISGDADDFLGRYRRNSHLTLALRYSF